MSYQNNKKETAFKAAGYLLSSTELAEILKLKAAMNDNRSNIDESL